MVNLHVDGKSVGTSLGRQAVNPLQPCTGLDPGRVVVHIVRNVQFFSPMQDERCPETQGSGSTSEENISNLFKFGMVWYRTAYPLIESAYNAALKPASSQ
jgi:hypothetical protein